MEAGFVHLRVHTEYSLVDGMVRIKPLMKALPENMPAIAITDQSNMMGLIKFYRASMGSGVKPIAGVDIWVQDKACKQDPWRMLLLAQTDAGYLNLTKLISMSYQQGQRNGKAIVSSEWIDGHTEGVIALSGGREGDVGQSLLNGKVDRAAQQLAHWMALFPDRFYLELQRTGREGEELYIQEALHLAAANNCPVVATNDVVFLEESDFDAHEVRVCIHDGYVLNDKRRAVRHSPQQYLRTSEEMAALFHDIPEALENTVEIAKRCNITLKLGTPVLPDFPIPDGLTEDEYFVKVSKEGLEWRLSLLFSEEERAAADFAEIRRPYDERLQIELDVILQMGFPGYFLIVADFIEWAKNNDVPVGPGRGSGAGSLVAYVLKITDLDPLEYDLLFERFLNPERVSMPDFDIDFCMDGRDRVISYVADAYGHEKVSQIITYGTMAAKAVVRDVGRVLAHPYGFVDRISKMVPFEIGMTLTKALKESEDLKNAYDDDEEVKALIDMALQLEGLARNAGKHAGGVVIAPSGLTDFCPLYCEPDGSSLVTQFDKDDAEAVGLVKFDFLGLRTLTIIDNALKTIQSARNETIDIAKIVLDDPAAFALLQRQETTAVFQLESRGMKDLIKRLQPDCFEDIVALVALFRPGPLQSGMVDDFINRKHGREPLAWPHKDFQLESLRPVLEPTYGIILYQEQVMQIAQVMAKYTLGGADLLRRAMGKKKPEEMAKQRAIFLEGCGNNDIDPELAGNIFDLVEKFAGYGFNKSHSAAYALLSYQTAWLKAHYPAEFMSAVLSADMDNTDKVVTLIEDCASMGLSIEPPDVNASAIRFTVRDKKTIIYGLGAIKGVGESALLQVIKDRETEGVYQDLDDFCRRMDKGKVNKRVMEALIRAGAMDCFGSNRSTLMARLPEALRAADQFHRDQQVGQDDLFGDMGGGGIANATESIPEQPEWSENDRLRAEKETLGLYLSGHPIDQYLDELSQFTQGRLRSQCERVVDSGEQRYGRQDVRTVVSGLIIATRTRMTNRGKMVMVTIDDRSARVEVVMSGEILEGADECLKMDQVLVVDGDLGIDDFSGGYRIRAKAIYGLDQARGHFARKLKIKIDGRDAADNLPQQLVATLTPYRTDDAGCMVQIEFRNGQASGALLADQAWRVVPNEMMLTQLNEVIGPQSAEVLYK